jgi:hypothetical protein
MEGILQDVPGTVVYLNDILVTGKDETEHLRKLDMVLGLLEEVGLTLNKAKCDFMLPHVTYLGRSPLTRKFEQSSSHPLQET